MISLAWTNVSTLPVRPEVLRIVQFKLAGLSFVTSILWSKVEILHSYSKVIYLGMSSCMYFIGLARLRRVALLQKLSQVQLFCCMTEFICWSPLHCKNLAVLLHRSLEMNKKPLYF